MLISNRKGEGLRRALIIAFVTLVLLAGASEAVFRTNPIAHPPRPVRSLAGQVLEKLGARRLAGAQVRASTVAAINDRLVAVGDGKGIRILASSPSTEALQPRSFLELQAEPFELKAAGSLVLAPSAWSGTTIIDVSSPSSPTVISVVPSGSSARSVCVQGRYAYVADWTSGLQVIDLYPRSAPHVLAFADTPGHSYDVAVANGRAYVADFDGGVRVFDVSQPASPSAVGAWQSIPTPTGIAIKGDYVYVVDEQRGLFVVDIRRPDAPRIVAELQLEAAGSDVVLTPNRAIVSDRAGGVSLFDITTPKEPRALGRTQLASAVVGMSVAEKYVFLATGRLLAMDVRR